VRKNGDRLISKLQFFVDEEAEFLTGDEEVDFFAEDEEAKE
jgi:hypothetical protein